MWKKGNPSALLIRIQIGAATMENGMELPQKIKNRPALQSSYSTFGDLSEKIQNINLKEYMHPYVNCSIIYNSQAMETTQVPTNGWVDKKALLHM